MVEHGSPLFTNLTEVGPSSNDSITTADTRTVLTRHYFCLSTGIVRISQWSCLVWAQTSIHRLETPLGWASAEPIAFVMLMSTSRCTARHSGAFRCAPIDFACPRGSRFQPKQGSDSSRRARDTAATMLHFTHFWRHRGESPMKHCQLYNCTCKKCVYMNISDKNWPNNVEFRGNFHRYAPQHCRKPRNYFDSWAVKSEINKGNRMTDLCDMYNLCSLTELWFAVYA